MLASHYQCLRPSQGHTFSSRRSTTLQPSRAIGSLQCHAYNSENHVQDLGRPASLELPPRQTSRVGREQQKPDAANTTTRRGFLLASVASLAAAQSGVARADEEFNLPKEYRQLVKRLSEGLSESIEAEASGASEAEVRRKADPAKDTVREFVRKWRDNPRVSSDITHAELKEALAELGEFYLAYGQRTKLTPPVRESVLRHLSAAKAALPEEPAKERGGAGLLSLF